MLAALMLAGRVGSGIASELGSMVVTEQINAMRALGTDPIKKLVVPRIIATTTMLPLAHDRGEYDRADGGLLVAVYALGINGNVYLSSAWDGLTYTDLFGGLLKPLVFGASVAARRLPLRTANLWRHSGCRPIHNSSRGRRFDSDSVLQS